VTENKLLTYRETEAKGEVTALQTIKKCPFPAIKREHHFKFDFDGNK
jgi:hypothetical protein